MSEAKSILEEIIYFYSDTESDLFSPESLGDDSRLNDDKLDSLTKLRESNNRFKGLEFFVKYAEEFLAQPNENKGKGGSVCPFTPKAIQQDSLYLSFLDVDDGPKAVEQLYDHIERFFDMFAKLSPSTGEISAVYKAVVFIVPNLQNNIDAIDAAQIALQPSAVARGFMVGEFHARNNTPGLKNPQWLPLRTSIPMLALRHMVIGDAAFLQNRQKYSEQSIKEMMLMHTLLFNPESIIESESNRDAETDAYKDDNSKGLTRNTVQSLSSIELIAKHQSLMIRRLKSYDRAAAQAKDRKILQLNQKRIIESQTLDDGNDEIKRFSNDDVNDDDKYTLETELQAKQLDLSSGSRSFLTKKFERLCSNYTDVSCRFQSGTSVSQGSIDISAEDQEKTDLIMSKFLSSLELGPDGERGNIKFSEEPCPNIDTILNTLTECLNGPGINTAHSGYMGHIGGGGVFTTALADYFLDCINRQAAVKQVCPGLTRIEMNVIDWCINLAGYNSVCAGGIFTTGSSSSTLSAIVAARTSYLERKFKNDSIQKGTNMANLIKNGTAYISKDGHGCVQKAFLILGFQEENFRKIKTISGQMCEKTLEDTIKDDISNGLSPFLVVGNGGATPTGVVDDLSRISKVCKTHGLWFHVDAAYGFFYRLLERESISTSRISANRNNNQNDQDSRATASKCDYVSPTTSILKLSDMNVESIPDSDNQNLNSIQDQVTRRGSTVQFLHGIEFSDSVTMCAHKSLGLPYGTGILIVARHTTLRNSHSQLGKKSEDSQKRDAYLPHASGKNKQEELPNLIDFCEYSTELSRPFRGFRVWLSLKLFGIDAFRKNLEKFRDMAVKLATKIDNIKGLKVVHWPHLAIFTFSRSSLSEESDSEANEKSKFEFLSNDEKSEISKLNKKLLWSINQFKDGGVLITGCVVEGIYLCRVAISCFRTSQEDVDKLQGAILESTLS